MSSSVLREVPLRTLSVSPIRNGAGEKGLEYDPQQFRYVRTTDIESQRTLKQSEKRSIPRDIGKKYRLTIGDLLFTAAGATIGKSYLHEVETEQCCFAGFLVRVQPRSQLLGRYLSHWSQSSHFHDQVWAGAVISTIPNFSAGRYRSLRVPLPETDSDLSLIVRYLDHAELRITKAIAAKQELLALLIEHRSTVIDELVLRGHDPEVKTIESNNAWMGEIPAHWEVVSSKSLFAHRKERSREGDEMLTASQSRGILKRDEFMALEGRRVMQVLVGSDILKHVEPNDFVISMRSFQGGLEWSKVSGCISSAYVMLIPGPMVHCEYFALLLKSRSYVSALRTTSDLVRDGQALRYSNFCQLQLPLPPLEEQRHIAAFADEKVSSLDRAIAPILKEIVLLKEYRTRLISDVVTGKLDVRDEAAKLPEIDPIELLTVAVGENEVDVEATDDD